MDMLLGDKLESADASRMQILLLDETVFTVGPNSQLVIDEFVYDPNTDTGKLTANFDRTADASGDPRLRCRKCHRWHEDCRRNGCKTNQFPENVHFNYPDKAPNLSFVVRFLRKRQVHKGNNLN